MYHYDAFDRTLVAQRVAQFREQTQRYLSGRLSEDEFRPLRLQNGLYLQRHGPMLRIAIPYGTLSARQMRVLADIADDFDRGVVHFTTRQNLQLNWVALDRVPDLLDELAAVDMHAIQTSGNCIRNVTTDHFAGVAADEVADPRPWAELLRQWSTLHPEFAHLPRKFKVAVNGSAADRTALRVHDLGLQLVRNAAGELGFRVYAGGGLGRTPLIAPMVRAFLPWADLLTYAEALLRVYNRHGRRDNAYKARLKILVKALGAEAFAREVEAEWAHLAGGPGTLTQAEVDRVAAGFAAPEVDTASFDVLCHAARLREEPAFARWVARNVHAHRVPGLDAVTLSLKAPGAAPGDATAAQMRVAAELAERFSQGELRVTHEQNLVLPHVPRNALFAVWQRARAARLASPTVGLATDLIACPGGDFCAQANARSLPLAAALAERFADLDELHDLGEIAINLSGCINACAHHHLGDIGVLGVDKHGEEWYQITLGGRQGHDARIGEVIGRAFAADEVIDAIERLLDTYRLLRRGRERFADCLARVGLAPFRAAAYSNAPQTERKLAHA